MVDVVANIQRVQRTVADIASLTERPVQDITIVAASKTRTPAAIKAAVIAGITDFGENYLQEALPKIRELRALELRWHFIGRIQSNKANQIATHFDWVQSVDRVKVAERLSAARHASSLVEPLNVCIQVNVDGEQQKAGADLGRLEELASAVTELPALKLRGFMLLPRLGDSREAFQLLRALTRQYQDRYDQIDTISMGMSSDYETAIKEGTTMIRLGTEIFGPRPK